MNEGFAIDLLMCPENTRKVLGSQAIPFICLPSEESKQIHIHPHLFLLPPSIDILLKLGFLLCLKKMLCWQGFCYK